VRRSLTRGQEKNNKKLVGKARAPKSGGEGEKRERQRGKREEEGKKRGGEGERRGKAKGMLKKIIILIGVGVIKPNILVS